MKTTLDVPDDLVVEIEQRTVREGLKLNDAVADLLRKGIVASEEPMRTPDTSVIGWDAKTGLPLIVTQHPAVAAQAITPLRLADLLLQQEQTWQHDAGR